MTHEQFTRQYLPLCGKMYALAYNLLRDRNEARDCVQDVYAELWIKRDTIEPDKPPLPFVLTMVRNNCLDRLNEKLPPDQQTVLRLRTIDGLEIEQIQEQFVPSPFNAEDVANDPSIPHGPTTLYLMDVSGKLIRVFEGSLDEMSDSQLSAQHIYLSTGVYFVMAFYEGQWHTKKLLVH